MGNEQHTEVNFKLFPNKFIKTRRRPPFSHLKTQPCRNQINHSRAQAKAGIHTASL